MPKFARTPLGTLSALSQKPESLSTLRTCLQPVPFFCEQEVATLITGGQKNLTKGRIASCAVIENCMIPSPANTAPVTPNAFQLAGQPPKLPLPVEGSRPPYNTWLLRPTRVSPPSQRHVDRFSRFSNIHPCAQQTDTQTDKPRYVCHLSE